MQTTKIANGGFNAEKDNQQPGLGPIALTNKTPVSYAEGVLLANLFSRQDRFSGGHPGTDLREVYWGEGCKTIKGVRPHTRKMPG